jgi:hypothetical protein
MNARVNHGDPQDQVCEGDAMGIRAKISVAHLEHLNTLEAFLFCVATDLWSWAIKVYGQ